MGLHGPGGGDVASAAAKCARGRGRHLFQVVKARVVVGARGVQRGGCLGAPLLEEVGKVLAHEVREAVVLRCHDGPLRARTLPPKATSSRARCWKKKVGVGGILDGAWKKSANTQGHKSWAFK